MANDPFVQSAVIAYYALFSLPSLLVIIVTVAGIFFGEKSVTDQITGELGNMIGEGTAKSIENMIQAAKVGNDSMLMLIVGIGVLIFSATGAFFQLKRSMNKIWSINPKKTDILGLVLNRAISLGMVLVIGFLLLVALVASALISGLSDYLSQYAPELSSIGLKLLNFLVSFIFIDLLFASIFKLLPDIKIPLKTTLVGASVTTVLFLLGEIGLTIYLSTSNPTSVFGGASSVVLILLWVFYACLIMFFGAEFTFQYAIFSKANVRTDRFGELSIYEEIKQLEERKLRYKNDKEPLNEFSEDEFKKRKQKVNKKE
jgi:membrane protein